MRRAVFPCVVVVCALGTSGRALAANPADVSAADALFREARAAARRGDHATACPKFRASYELDPTVGTLLNVADCDEQDGHLVQASARFELALHRISENDDRVPYVKSRMRALDERIPRVVANAAVGAPAKLKIDGVDAAVTATGISHRVDPGKHDVQIERSGQVEHVAIDLKEGERREIELARPKAPAEGEGGRRTLGLVLGGVGVASLVASGVAIKLMFDAKSTADAECIDAECKQAGIDATKDGKTYGTIGAITFAAGAVGVGLGAFFLFSKPPSPRRADGEPRSSAAVGAKGRVLGALDPATFSVGPLVAPSGGGLVLRGSLF